jgi:hypothetical protein
MTWSRKYTLIAGLALIALTNAVALGGVAWNRSGGPDSVLKLTQRELWRLHEFGFDREAAGLTLNLHWRVLAKDASGSSYAADRYSDPEWLDRAKLAALGFDVSRRSDAQTTERRSERLLPREALVVLELDGPTYRKSLERARERAEKEAAREAAQSGKKKPGSPGLSAAEQLKREETANSRLFAVDAGLDAQALRAKHPDRSRYAIVRGSVRARFDRSRAGEAQWTGYIDDLDNVQVNVQKEFRAALGAVPRSVPYGTPVEGGPSFEVIVAFGKRFEPWVVAAGAAK